MAFVIDKYVEFSPYTLFLTHENGVDVYVGIGTDKVKQNSDEDFNEKVFQYHQNFQADNPERMILVTDDFNTARKMAYLLAGYDKYHFTGEQNEDGSLIYEGVHESNGVYMAEINLSEYDRRGRDFPQTDYELDGAIFYGAKNEEDIRRNLNALKSCDLPFVSLIIDEDLWKTNTVKRLVLDYSFAFFDARYCEPGEKYYIDLLRAMGEDNESDPDLQKILYPHGKTDESLKELYERIRLIRGTDFRDDDLIRLVECWKFERLMDDRIGTVDLMYLWEEGLEEESKNKADS